MSASPLRFFIFIFILQASGNIICILCHLLCHFFYAIVFFFTHILMNVYINILFFFVLVFKLPRSVDVSATLLGVKRSAEAQFSYRQRRGAAFSAPPSSTLYIFQLFVLSWELRFKSLTNVFVCWTAATPQDVTRFCGSCCVTLWDWIDLHVRVTSDSGCQPPPSPPHTHTYTPLQSTGCN